MIQEPKILKEICKKVLSHVGVKKDPILELAMELEKALRSLFYKKEIISKCRFLFRYNSKSNRFST